MNFEGKVVIVTGAGQGLGRIYALGFGAKGAKVVVNDLGGSTKGDGADGKVADKVVAEIKAAGGEAVANYDSVVDGDKIVKTAIDTWGRIDIVINNAGILRDVGFQKMKHSDFDLIQAVHLKGSYMVTRAAWPYMKEQKFGRIIFVASAAGLYGNYGQSNYSAAKLGLVGFCNTLAVEGKKANIFCNTIAPLAASRMTEKIMPPQILKELKPEYVCPLVEYLCHDSSKHTGGVYETGGGWIAKVRFQRSAGAVVPRDNMTPDGVASIMKAVENFDKPSYPSTPSHSIMGALEALKASKL